MRIMCVLYSGLYWKFQTQLSMISLKGPKLIGIQNLKLQRHTSSGLLLRSKITWQQQSYRLRHTPSMPKFILLTTRLYKLYKTKLPVLETVQQQESPESKLRTAPTQKEGTPTRFMLRYQLIFNPGASIDKEQN